MPSSDRAFRALARAEPEVIVALLRVLVPGAIDEGATVTLADVDDSRLDASPHLQDTDWLARVGERQVKHLECQGYRDATFPDRAFRYHLGTVLRYPDHDVRTFALWLIEPPAYQCVTVIQRGRVCIEIDAMILPRASAQLLLRDPLTACFAPGADPGPLSVNELCRAVARSLRDHGATYHQRRMAMVVALMRGRYPEMEMAMRAESVEPVIIEDFVKYGEDLGFERGLELLRATVLDVLDAREIAVSVAERALVALEASPERLRMWARRAATARSVGDVF